jgi:hypothetical protein
MTVRTGSSDDKAFIPDRLEAGDRTDCGRRGGGRDTVAHWFTRSGSRRGYATPHHYWRKPLPPRAVQPVVPVAPRLFAQDPAELIELGYRPEDATTYIAGKVPSGVPN